MALPRVIVTLNVSLLSARPRNIAQRRDVVNEVEGQVEEPKLKQFPAFARTIRTHNGRRVYDAIVREIKFFQQASGAELFQAAHDQVHAFDDVMAQIQYH